VAGITWLYTSRLIDGFECSAAFSKLAGRDAGQIVILRSRSECGE
jgi:hypothetical protein